MVGAGSSIKGAKAPHGQVVHQRAACIAQGCIVNVADELWHIGSEEGAQLLSGGHHKGVATLIEDVPEVSQVGGAERTRRAVRGSPPQLRERILWQQPGEGRQGSQVQR